MATQQDSKPTVSDEDLQKCYEAFTRRRLIRGERSIRTPEGFQRLHKRYQRTSSVVAETGPAIFTDGEDDDSGCLRNVLNVFFNPKVLRVITETCWRLAHFGGGTLNAERDCAGLELDAEKYSTFSLRLIQWVIPELPRRQVQDLVQYDWELDRKFDELGRDGLSLRGFEHSLLDLLVSCTDGTVAKCLEFLNLMARWLQHSLPPYIIHDTAGQVDQDDVANNYSNQLPKAVPMKIVWNIVPFSMMAPCQIGPQGLYCELKTKVCSSPIVVMLLAADEKPLEMVLATNPKLLLKRTESHKVINNKIAGCWTFHMNSKTSILLVPGSTVNHLSKALYACFRTCDSAKPILESRMVGGECDSNNQQIVVNEEQSEAQNAALTSASTGLTLCTSVPEQSSLRIGSKNVFYRMESMSPRIFTLEHSTQLGEEITIVLTASLLQSNNSVPTTSGIETNSTFRVSDSYPQDGEVTQDDAHTLIFIIKSTLQRKNGSKQDQAILPRQWFTCLNTAKETKTILFESPEMKNGEKVTETQCREIYQLFIFTLHGVNIEVACNAKIPAQTREESDPDTSESEADNPNKFSEVTSSRLLKDLLQLQKIRQLDKTSEPLPDMVVGTPVSTTKPGSTTESLRSKILRSRQEARYSRYLELQAEIQSKILERKTSRKTTTQESDHSDESVQIPLSPDSELEKRVNQLAAFFHEMAVHQPRDDELIGGATEAAEAVAEEQLLKRFSEMFDYDSDLQNALDEEKWSTDPVKIARRRDSIYTNLPKTMPTTRADIPDKCSRTYEDYENTAQYIEQLMEDVTNHTAQQQEQQNLEDEERKRAVVTQLVDSWQYTQHRVYKAETRKRIDEMEKKRRSQWLQSEYIQAKRGDKPERPVLILPKQRFLVQEHSIPSNAIWEVPGASNNPAEVILPSGPAVDLVSPMRPTSPHTEKVFKPQRPLVRPATVATSERSSNITALRSAAISRARVRRIRSAHSTARGESTPSRIQVISPRNLDQPMSPQQEIPDYSLSTLNDEESPNGLAPTKSLTSPRFVDDPVHLEAPSLTSPTEQGCFVDADTKVTLTEKSPVKFERRRKRKKRSKIPTDIHFRRRVLELVSISAQLQALDGEEWKEAQGIANVDELSNMPCLPPK
ncbi:hypothetical protein F442_00094 [Phytophthora nicotianae P10297]|uniref:Uncharacterized protein n=1 Tax=Phytophthora nicotianae P10297 TaxID=1317064 RepID=W3A6T6_PHYNI|nr:hypothetical protein F442_00094 [Phytophthora nicotianae P10297]